jgi:drug/metabolite transporter superfamily protein YnfA
MATLRADLGAFFATAGGFALWAAIRRAPGFLTAPLMLISLALAGRFLALAVTPFASAMIPPMVAEAVMVALFAAGRFMRAAP